VWLWRGVSIKTWLSEHWICEIKKKGELGGKGKWSCRSGACNDIMDGWDGYRDVTHHHVLFCFVHTTSTHFTAITRERVLEKVTD